MGPAGRRLLPLIFVLLAVPLLATLAVLVPAGEAPDEVAHILRIDSVRHGALAGFRRSVPGPDATPVADAAVKADPGLFFAGFAFDRPLLIGDKHLTKDRLAALFEIRWTDGRQAFSVPNTAVYPPFLYAPAALAFELSKRLGAGPYLAILLARLLNAGLFVVLAAAAIACAERGRVAVFAVLCLPMTLSLAASLNHDGLIIGCAALAGALLTRGEPRAWWCAAALIGLAAMAKPFLLPFALLLPVSFPGRWRPGPVLAGPVLAGTALGALPAVAWSLAMAAFVAVPFIRGAPRAAGPLYAGPAGTVFATTSPAEQLRILLAHPLRLLTLPAEGMWLKGTWLWHEVVGILGTLDLDLPAPVYLAWMPALAAAIGRGFLAIGPRDAGPRRWDRAGAALLALAASLWLMLVLQYLSWTPVGDEGIDGIQGRYLIPMLALTLPCLAVPLLPGSRTARLLLALPPVLLAVGGTMLLPVLVAGTYYLR